MAMSTQPGAELGRGVRSVAWSIGLRGLLALIFGLIALSNPGAAAGAFVVIFAVYAFADGLLDFALAGTMGRAGGRWGWYVFEGLVTVALGVIALAYPRITLFALEIIIAIRAIALGFVELAAAFSWQGFDSRWLLGLTGVLSIVLGFILLADPMRGGMALIYTIGIYAVVLGVMLIGLGIRVGRANLGEMRTTS
jgi:uncharacterized membrane protein HdeD (DUF308 family)